MKRLLIIFISISLAVACDNANAPECLKTRGSEVTVDINVDTFNTLWVNNEFEVIITAGATQQVRLTTGENLVDEIIFEVIGGELIISNNNGCGWTRDYDFPVVHITHPNLTQIRQNGGGIIKSAGVLNYPDLILLSEKSSGNFELELNSENLQIVNNELSNYYLSGTVTTLNVGFFSGDGRFEGTNLVAENVGVFQRGTNDIIVHATNALTGRILATGDVIFVQTRPARVEVSEENRGRLIDQTNG